jgi:hypothetical protein
MKRKRNAANVGDGPREASETENSIAQPLLFPRSKRE